ncbi:MAG: hypothetical protein WBW73_05955, partial [Rhodoplanes sp.]
SAQMTNQVRRKTQETPGYVVDRRLSAVVTDMLPATALRIGILPPSVTFQWWSMRLWEQLVQTSRANIPPPKTRVILPLAAARHNACSNCTFVQW